MTQAAIPAASRGLRAAGAVLAAAAVALSAYAAHGAEGGARTGLQTAALFAFGHGLALVALPRAGQSRTMLAALAMLLAGTLLFSGALVSKYLFDGPSATAPFGGSVLILGWLLCAVSVLKD